jgi:hypothetical protein
MLVAISLMSVKDQSTLRVSSIAVELEEMSDTIACIEPEKQYNRSAMSNAHWSIESGFDLTD